MKQYLWQIIFFIMIMFSVVYSNAEDLIVDLTAKQINQYVEGLKDTRVEYLRQVLDLCIETELKNDQCEALRLSNIDLEEIQGEFLLYQAEDLITGGYGMAIIFTENPTKMYRTVVYGNSPIRVQQFIDTKVPEEKMLNLSRSLILLLENPKLLK